MNQLDKHLQKINFSSQSNLQWPLQLINLRKQINVYKRVRFTDTALKSGMVVADSHPDHLL